MKIKLYNKYFTTPAKFLVVTGDDLYDTSPYESNSLSEIIKTEHTMSYNENYSIIGYKEVEQYSLDKGIRCYKLICVKLDKTTWKLGTKIYCNKDIEIENEFLQLGLGKYEDKDTDFLDKCYNISNLSKEDITEQLNENLKNYYQYLAQDLFVLNKNLVNRLKSEQYIVDTYNSIYADNIKQNDYFPLDTKFTECYPQNLSDFNAIVNAVYNTITKEVKDKENEVIDIYSPFIIQSTTFLEGHVNKIIIKSLFKIRKLK